ncbi:hypothetical protein BDV29DRAFT_180748 [Aspergillus leporis]|uniref:Uncharacterized protein n=1 Tax=Aspergillus leporis TaxID=41062 RepID=A0A5N5WPU0_9EURO|nr:hypothetical protein BDV29DRAFT_180748 [Aspergillus leporis]
MHISIGFPGFYPMPFAASAFFVSPLSHVFTVKVSPVVRRTPCCFDYSPVDMDTRETKGPAPISLL